MRYDIIVYVEPNNMNGHIVDTADDLDTAQYYAGIVQDVLATLGHHGYIAIESRSGETMDEYDFWTQKLNNLYQTLSKSKRCYNMYQVIKNDGTVYVSRIGVSTFRTLTQLRFLCFERLDPDWMIIETAMPYPITLGYVKDVLN